MRRLLSRLAATVLVTAAAGLGATATVVTTAAPAAAAACSGSTGVTVVVDPHGLGGGLSQDCAAEPGIAAGLFTSTGHEQVRVRSQPGFVCRVDGEPASDPCVNTPPATAYWSLWWSDGTSTSWTYSSLGVDSLRVPAGGSVAWSWNAGEGNVQPGVAPAARVAAAPSSSSPTTGSSGETSSGGSTTSAPGASPRGGTKPGKGTGQAVTPSRAPGTTAPVAPTTAPPTTRAAGATPSAGVPAADPPAGDPAPPAPTETATDGPGGLVEFPVPSPMAGETSAVPTEAATPATPATPPSTEVADAAADVGDDGLPTWVTPVVLVLLLGAAGAVALLRRRLASTD